MKPAESTDAAVRAGCARADDSFARLRQWLQALPGPNGVLFVKGQNVKAAVLDAQTLAAGHPCGG
jgi:hypothetical protein